MEISKKNWEVSFRIFGDVPPKKNKYRMGQGRMYTTKEVNDYMIDFFYQFKQRFPAWPAAKIPNALEAHFYTQRDKDLDNLLNGLMDALQYAGAIVNDKQIERLVADKQLVMRTEDQPYVDIVLRFI